MASVGLEGKVIIDHETLLRPTPAKEKKKLQPNESTVQPVFSSQARMRTMTFIQDVENSSSVFKNSYVIVVVRCWPFTLCVCELASDSLDFVQKILFRIVVVAAVVMSSSSPSLSLTPFKFKSYFEYDMGMSKGKQLRSLSGMADNGVTGEKSPIPVKKRWLLL